MTPQLRAIIYARVSSDPHKTQRSVEQQEAEGRKTCEANGWDLVHVFIENDKSASKFGKATRAVYEEVIAWLEADKADVLVCWESSRSNRDLGAYLELRGICADNGVLYAYNGNVYDLTQTEDKFLTGLHALLDERESGKTHDRVLRGVADNAVKGRPHGKLAYGYRRIYDDATGELVAQVIEDEQAKIINEMADRSLAGESNYAIGHDLKARRVLNPVAARRAAVGKALDDLKNGPYHWDPSTVKRILTNPAYVAKRVFKGEIIGDADWPIILDEDKFYRLQSKQNDPRRATTRERAVKHLLSGIALCGFTGCDNMVKVLKNRGRLSYQPKPCFHVSRAKQPTEEHVQNLVVRYLSTLSVADLVLREDAPDTAATAKELRARLDGFYAQAAEGKISPQGLAVIESQLLPKIKEAENAVQAHYIPTVAHQVIGPNAGKLWEGLSLEVKREVLRSLFEIRILPAGAGRRAFDPTRITVQLRLP